jgi:hypothetical protein
MIYTIKDHIHNYAIWTAARAVQRGFAKTEIIKTAIEATRLKSLIDNNEFFTKEQFDEFHRKTAHQILDSLAKHNEKISKKATYGRAAKIIAIYIKTAVIIRDSQCILSRLAHPPIDSILLQNLDIKGITWTRLSEDEYFNLIYKLRALNFEYFWELEKYWSPVRGE